MALSSMEGSDMLSQSEYSALEGDDASDKYRAHSRRDLEMLSPLATREVSGSLGRQLWMKQKDATIAKLQREALAPDRPTSTFSILPLDFSNFMLRFGNTPLADEYLAAVIDYLHVSTDYQFVPQEDKKRDRKSGAGRVRIQRVPSDLSQSMTSVNSFATGTSITRGQSSDMTISRRTTSTGIHRVLSANSQRSGTSAQEPRRIEILSAGRDRKEHGRAVESEVLGDLPPVEFPSSLADSQEGQVLAGIYRSILFRWSNPKLLSRERAFFELLHLLATEAGCSTFPERLRPRIAREIARIGRTDFFNSTRRVDEAVEDAKVSKITAKELFGLKQLGLDDAKDKRIINVMNLKRKALHPHIKVTVEEALNARAPMTSAVVPTPFEKMTQGFESIKAQASLRQTSRENTRQNSQRPPFDGAFNMGRNNGFGPADGMALRAATAAAGGGHMSWIGIDQTCPQSLSPDKRRIHRLVGANGRKFLREMYTREIYEKVFCFDHWAANLPPREAEVPAVETVANQSTLSQLSVAAEMAGDEDVPHYLLGREQGVLRQAINDEKIDQKIKVLEEQTRFIQERSAQAAERSHERKVKRAKKRAREANLQKRMAIMQEKGCSALSTPSEHGDGS